MNVHDNQEYFLLSFRFDKTKPEDFGLRPCTDETGVYLRAADGSRWIQKDLYDYGWGNEYGFVRLPELDFDRLWQLLTRSKIQDNRYGAAWELENRYPVALQNRLWEVFSQPRPVAPSLLKALEILDLRRVGDLNHLVGQNIGAVEAGYQKQQLINWKLELSKSKPDAELRHRNVYLWGSLLFLFLWALTFGGRFMLHKTAQQTKIRAMLQLGKLAPLPQNLTGLQTDDTEEWNPKTASGGMLLKFAAPRRQISGFLENSPGLRAVKPQPFVYSEWSSSHVRTVAQNPWFDPITPHGRLFEIGSERQAVTGRLIVDDSGGVVYLEMSRVPAHH